MRTVLWPTLWTVTQEGICMSRAHKRSKSRIKVTFQSCVGAQKQHTTRSKTTGRHPSADISADVKRVPQRRCNPAFQRVRPLDMFAHLAEVCGA